MKGIRTRRARTRWRKVVAIAAAGTVALVGATVTSLASWLDEEWVTAGVNGTSGIASSSFEIQQHVATDTSPLWTDRETGPGGVVDFGTLASSLSPGASVVGYVSLRATQGSVAGTLTLQPAPGNASSGVLGAALRYSAWLHDTSSTCTDADYSDGAISQLVDDQPLTVGSGSTTFALAAGSSSAAGDDQTVCFRLTLPVGSSDSLQGKTAAVGWYFDAVSN
jgi:hypothetical protein